MSPVSGSCRCRVSAVLCPADLRASRLRSRQTTGRAASLTQSHHSTPPHPTPMNRRRFLATAATASVALAASRYSAQAADDVKGVTDAKTKLTPPARGGIPVAVLISEHVNVVDFSG